MHNVFTYLNTYVKPHITAQRIRISTLSLTGLVLLGGVMPHIANQASEAREAHLWQERAEKVFAAIDAPAAIDPHIEALFEQTSLSTVQRDDLALTPLAPLGRQDFDEAAFKMSERDCLATAVYYEARSETPRGQQAVAEVVLNRIQSRHYPGTVCSVVYQGSHRKTGCQFSFTCDGSMARSPKGKAWERSLEVARTALSDGYAPITWGATHYHTDEVSPRWSGTLRPTRKIGSHIFYRLAPRGWKPSSEMSIAVAPPS